MPELECQALYFRSLSARRQAEVCMATGKENAMALGTLGAMAGGIGETHLGQGKRRLAATSIGILLGATTGILEGNKFDAVNENKAAAVTLLTITPT